MNTIDVMECGEISCEYCSKDKCLYMTTPFKQDESLVSSETHKGYVKVFVESAEQIIKEDAEIIKNK